ncbi:heme-binding domain-containing protein [Aquirufa sp. ROCK-SH2]
MKKKLLAGLVVVLIAIQFVPTEKNDSNDMQYDISTKYTIPADVDVVLKNACNDCHSNSTTYPWYSNIQPVGFWLDHHVNDGKRHLNFSTFTKMPIAVQNHKLEEVIEQTEEKEMPMPSYTYFGLHSYAKLSEEQRALIINWAKGEMAKLKAAYPADSLKMKPRKKA